MTYEGLKALCSARRSIRYFDDKPVARNDILRLLELARMAPSVENLQPWHFHVIVNPALKRKLMEASCYGNFLEGAGVFIIVTVDKTVASQLANLIWNPRELEYSCMAAMEHVLLGATAMGLGSSWVSLHHGIAHEILGLQRHVTVVGGLMIGHYKPGEEEGHDGRQRKPLVDIYTFHD